MRGNGEASTTSATVTTNEPQPVRTIRMILDLHQQLAVRPGAMGVPSRRALHHHNGSAGAA